MKHEMAKKYYNDEDYYRALPLFEELVSVYKATDKGENIYYYYAYCHYGLGDYMLAGHHFKNFVQSFPNSELTEDCQFMYANCYYNDSPISSLDQTSTFKAIDAFQLFINLYPKSPKVKDCNEIIDKLRQKLEIKSFQNAKLYYKIGDYKAAMKAMENTLDDYPAIFNRDEILFLILKSHFLFALNSIDEKKSERLKSTINNYYKFIDYNPNSVYVKEAEQIFESAQKYLENKKLNF